MVSGCDVPVGTFEIPRVKWFLAANARPADSIRRGAKSQCSRGAPTDSTSQDFGPREGRAVSEDPFVRHRRTYVGATGGIGWD